MVLFMKGLPSAPQCGFSMKTVNILNSLGTFFEVKVYHLTVFQTVLCDLNSR